MYGLKRKSSVISINSLQLKRKRDERREVQRRFEEQLKYSSKVSKLKESPKILGKGGNKPSKEDADRTNKQHKKSQYSSLFKSNPDIPQVKR